MGNQPVSGDPAGFGAEPDGWPPAGTRCRTFSRLVLPTSAHVPLTMPRLRSVILSSELELVVRKRVADDRHAPTDLDAEAARDWLRDRHVSGIAYFPVWASDNAKAPELRALDGTVIPLEAGPDDRPLDTEPLPISLVAQHVFCPRRAWLEAAGETTDTYQMAVGIAEHAPTENPATGRPDRLRTVEVVQTEWGMTGRCDTVERELDGSLTVIEHKATPVRRRPDVTEPMRVQLHSRSSPCAPWATGSAARRCTSPATASAFRSRWPGRHPSGSCGDRRHPADCDQPDGPAAAGRPPRCTSCSHARYPPRGAVRPIGSPPNYCRGPHSRVVHLVTPGSRASVKDGRVLVSHRGEEISSIPLERVQSLVLHGNVDVSGALIREMMWRSRPIVWCTEWG